MAIRKNKYAGRCEICRKYVTWDDYEVVRDLTIVAIRPAYQEAHASCGNPEHEHESIEELVESLLKDTPVCSACWHETNKKHNLGTGALTMVRAGVAVPDGALFVWARVRQL